MNWQAFPERTNTMATGERKDPYRGFNFKLEIDGITRAGFREASGLDADESEGRQDAAIEPRKITGLNKYSNITLKRGVTDDHDLWDWHKSAATANVQRKHGSIVLTDESGEENVRWNFVNGWPTKWVGPSFNATSNDVAIETLEIAHEGLTKA
jgi:phage tail-like protein